MIALAALLALATGCGSPDVGASGQVIQATLLVEADASQPRWTRDVEVAQGTDGYEFLKEAVDGDLEADWTPEFRSHFVKSIQGVVAKRDEFWSVFVWNEDFEAWEPLPVGADLYSVKQGQFMAWALVEFDPKSPPVPVNTP